MTPQDIAAHLRDMAKGHWMMARGILTREERAMHEKDAVTLEAAAELIEAKS